ncbi:hypothetical protein [Aquipuribacter sp. MA13-6]|uniref:hypothetical protein n=1 Tax=unclassified Aquipuribacter TaxID=2635084 RepID=UPI003EE9E5AF
MENTTTTPVYGRHAVAALQVCVLVPAFKPRPTGGVRLLADGDFLIAPPGPPLID